MKISFKDQVLPHIVALAVFYIMMLIMFKPILLDGLEINQHDILMHRGGAQELVEYRDATGEEGLWANSMFSGMPAYMVNLQWSRWGVDFLNKVLYGGLPHPVGVMFAALLSAYIMLLCFGVRPYLALAIALGYGLSSYLYIGLGAGHNSRIAAIAYAPLVVGAIHRVFKKPGLFSVSLFALALSLQLRFNHLQITYYLILFLFPYLIIEAIALFKSGDGAKIGKVVGGGVLATIIALATYLGPFMTTLEYSKYSIRGKSELTKEQGENNNFSQEGISKSYAFEYSAGIGEPWTLFIPNYVGGASAYSLLSDEDSKTLRYLRGLGANQAQAQQAQQLAQFARGYWGVQRYSAPYYAGAVLVLFFVLGFIYAPRKYSIWLGLIALFGIMLTWGSNFQPFNYWMFDHFPGYNKFRSVTFAIFIPLLSICLLAGLAAETLFAKKFDKAEVRKLLISVGGVAAFLIVLYIAGGFGNFLSPNDGSLPEQMKNVLARDRRDLFRSDVLRSLLFVLLGGAMVWLTAIQKLKAHIAALILAGLVAIDMTGVNNRVFGEDNFQRSLVRQYFQADAADQAINKLAGPADRVLALGNPWADNKPSYHHQSVGGYHGAKMRRYQDLVDYYMGAEHQRVGQNLQTGQSAGAGTPLLNMFNTRFVRFNTQQGPGYRENPSAFGPAWFAQEVKAVNSPDEEIEALGTFDLSRTAVIDQSKFSELPTGGAGTITVQDYVPGAVTYQVNATQGGLAVFSEVYYPVGWEVALDGEPVDMYRVNYLLRGVEVPAGPHTVTMTFRPRSYTLGNMVMMIASTLLLLGMVVAIGLTVREQFKTAPATA